MELFAEDELEVDRLFAAVRAGVQFDLAKPRLRPLLTHAHLQTAPPCTTPLARAPSSFTSLQQLDPVRFPSPKTDEEKRAAREAGIPKIQWSRIKIAGEVRAALAPVKVV